MTQEEYRRYLLGKIADATTRRDLRETLEEADRELDQSSFTKAAKEGFFHNLLEESQDNSATMENSGAAQEIVNEILNQNK